MVDAPNTQPPATPAVTFEDAPGEHGFDRMFPGERGDEQPPAEANPGETPAGDTPPVEGDEHPPAAPDPALMARLSQVEAQNAQLVQQLSGLLSQRSQETLAMQLTRLEDAVAAGDAAAAETARKAIEGLKTQAAVAATALPAQNSGGYQSSAPAGHWSHNLTGEAQNWMAAQNWWGTDGARTAAVRQMANHMAPEKFATKEAYFQALLSSADQSIGRGAPPATPTPRAGSQGAQRGAAGSAARGGDITSIKQLQGAERAAAEDALRYGNLTEAAYLASYNAVRKTQAARNKGR